MFRAGFGSAVITPPVPVRLAGFSARTEPALSVHDDLEARAVWLAGESGDGESASGESSGAAVCLVVCDLLGMSAEYATPIRAAIAAALGLPVDAVLTASTHTHSGPSVIARTEGLGWPTPEGYADLLVSRCTAAAVAARRSAEPVSLHYVRAPLPDGLSINRRDLPYDPHFAVLDARRPDGSRAGLIANIAIHPVALGPQALAVSTDWVGPFRDAVEAAAGGAAMLLSGALGDVNPQPHEHPDPAGDFDQAASLGRAVAGVVEAVLADAAEVEGGIGVIARRCFPAPVGPSLLTMITEVSGTIEVELVEWAIGDVRLVSLPGEAFCALGRKVEDARGSRVLLAGLAPVWQGYLPDPFGVGYEEGVSFGLPAVAAITDALLDVP
jgi:hypothetical protein